MTYADTARHYAEQVVSGEILACKYVKQACQRQLDDLAKFEAGDFPYRWNPNLTDMFGNAYYPAERICKFIELLPHIKGTWESPTITLEPWQIFNLTTVFGWIDNKGRRRYRTAYLEVARKNAKSTLTSGIGLYLLVADNEPGAEIFSAATTRDQARIVWEVAHKMTQRSEGLRERFGVETTAHAIHVPATSSSFKALSRDQGGNHDGLNVHGGLIDELHAHKTRDVFDVIETATGSRTQSLLWCITTAGSNRAGICYEQRGYTLKILDKVQEDDSYFGIVYTIDEDDDWADESSWIKANPNYGVSVSPDDLERKKRKAQSMASAVNNFLTKHLNVWVNAGTAWMDMKMWDRQADHNLKLSDFAGQPCHLGVDLATKTDIACFNVTFKREINGEDHYYGFTLSYLNEEAAEDGRNSQYSGWVRSGHLLTTDGNVTDHRCIEEDIRDIASNYNVVSVAYDDWQGQYLANNLSDDGLRMVNFKLNTGNMSEPMTEWEALVLSGRYHHDGCPVMTWMVSNVVAHRDVSDHIYPRKEFDENKIDGAVAQIMALGRWLADPVSPYASRGFIQL